MANVKPLPCPVCGKQPTLHEYVNHDVWTVNCFRDGPAGAYHDLNAEARTQATAIRRWNKLVGGKKP